MKTGKLVLLSFVSVIAFSSMAMAAENFRAYVQQRNEINSQDDLSVIQAYHRKFTLAPYVVVDKKQKLATYFGEQGQTLASADIRTYSGDELERGGSGIYTYAGTRNSLHYLKAEKDQSLHTVFQGSMQIPAGTRVYVLPETDAHHFRIRNHQLTFNAARVLRNRPDFNYSPANYEVRKSTFRVDFTDAFTNNYVLTLQREKPTLMKLLKLENDEYNMLAEFAFGVLAPETEYGQNFKYRLKQTAPVIVSLLKGNGLDTSANSRGPTQIKRIPDVVVEHYKIEKHQLKRPHNAAIATLAFAAEQIKELRNLAHYHEPISEETLQDYLYYLYNGRRGEIRKGTATPDRNIAIRKIREAITHLTIEE
ncbi:hypothetical protein QJS83_07050 [Bdellovibrio sp. 22V]|uniref:hypothetical protein n=1 Tax=Bdellovibrio TaxID=958 RepID=UPI0025431A8B|nr:hypothetical protein [Bdellovibrio sp. 22V]WII73629.1 hypothetical protein QJS83_07050 [Bdellovibrio sp. 22V]